MNKEIEELLNEFKKGTHLFPEYREIILSYIEQLENNRDKALEYIESHFIFNDKTGECCQKHTFDKDNVKKLYDILKGGSDE